MPAMQSISTSLIATIIGIKIVSHPPPICITRRRWGLKHPCRGQELSIVMRPQNFIQDIYEHLKRPYQCKGAVKLAVDLVLGVRAQARARTWYQRHGHSHWTHSHCGHMHRAHAHWISHSHAHGHSHAHTHARVHGSWPPILILLHRYIRIHTSAMRATIDLQNSTSDSHDHVMPQATHAFSNHKAAAS